MPPATNDDRFALLIATNTYVDDNLENLEAACRDVEQLAGVLRDKAIGNYDVTVLMNPTAQEARLATERFFARRKATDVLVFHFAGHAFRNEEGDELFLAVADTRKRDAPQTTSLTGHDLRSLLEGSRARRKLLLLDCCRSGALRLSRGAEDATAVGAEELERGLNHLVPPESSPDVPGFGTVVIGAARADELAFESPGRGGLLTSAVVDGLSTGEADRAHRGSVSTDDLFSYVTERLQHNSRQHPVRQESGRSGAFIIAESPWRKHRELPGRLRDLARSESAEDRRTAASSLRRLAASDDLLLAATARQRLQEMRDFDTDWGVRALAERALEDTRLNITRSSVDFGPVLSGADTPEAEVRVDGPPLAQDWSLATSDPAVMARRTSDGAVKIRLRPTGRGRPYDATVTLDSSAGTATIQIAAEVRAARLKLVAAAVAARAAPWRAPIVRRRLSRPCRWLRRWPAVAGVLMLMGAMLTADQAAAVSWCTPGAELRVLTTEFMRTAVVPAANAFVSRSGGGCGGIHVTVAGAVSDGYARDRLVRGWPDEELRAAGPQPDVWLPESSVQVELLRAAQDARDSETPTARRFELPSPAEVRTATTASSQLVVAVPARGSPRASMPWSEVSDGRWKVVRPDPSSSSSGLLATEALYAKTGDAVKVERALEPSQGDDVRNALCQLKQQPDGSTPAYLVPRKMLRDYEAGLPLGAGCATVEDPGNRPALQEMRLDHPASEVPVHLDLPCIVIKTEAWGDQRQRDLASQFCSFLSSRPGQAVLGDKNLDPPILPDPKIPQGNPEEVLDTWTEARRPWRVLLVVDVSGSMRSPMGGEPRITVATRAAGWALDASALGQNDDIGLWKFATRLAGERDYAAVVPMGAALKAQRDAVKQDLGGLSVTNQDTGLYDTIQAGVQELRNRPAPKDTGATPVNRLIVLTDGKNDDDRSISVSDLGAFLRQGTAVQVSLIAVAGANCEPLNELRRADLLTCFDGTDAGSLEAAFGQVLP